jgi:hypothetical protein
MRMREALLRSPSERKNTVTDQVSLLSLLTPETFHADCAPTHLPTDSGMSPAVSKEPFSCMSAMPGLSLVDTA